MQLNLIITFIYRLKRKKIATRCLFNAGFIPRSKQTLHDQISLFRFNRFCHFYQVVATVTFFNKFDNILSLKQKFSEQIVIKCPEVRFMLNKNHKK